MSEKILELAKGMGYDPDYEGEDKKTPEEYIKYGASIQRRQSNKIKDLAGIVEDMKGEFKRLNTTFESTLTAQQEKHKSDLEKQRKEIEARMEVAVDEADREEFLRLKSRLADVNKEESSIKPAPAINKDQEFFNSWISGKEWINTDATAGREFQRAIANYRIDNGGRPDVVMSVQKELEAAENHLKEKFPERFGIKPKEEPPAGGPGEGKNKKSVTDKKITYDQLSGVEKQRYDKLKKIMGKDFSEENTLRNIKLSRESK